MNKGFHVFIKHGDSGLMDAAGNYVCRDSKGRSSPHYKVNVPKGFALIYSTECFHSLFLIILFFWGIIDLYIRVTPNVNYIRVAYGQTQMFKCESKTGNVTLTFSGDRQPRPPRQVKSEINEDSEYPFVAMYEVNPMEMSAEHTVINCVSLDNGNIVHTWEYSTYGKLNKMIT